MASLSLAAVGLTTAPSASAAVGDCPRAYVCVWDNGNYSGAPKWKSMGDLSNLWSANGLSIVNNGVAYPGGDHIRYKLTPQVGPSESGCLHYPPDSNKTAFTGTRVTLDYAKWGAEC
ncbi:peptidase inhibitor family I36 protein [Streptomyces sp. NPDC056347]|uniref:peptidase inhibitor family I36 protein n=1 Tax=Streptomyces sp. NPDC056347 TaxID=3345790 RepID=UPI0035E3A40D